MTTTWKSIRRALLMGLSWAVAWIPFAILIGVLIVDPDNSMDEPWFAVGMYPGFLCGVLFYASLATGAGGRIETLSLARAAALGAVCGVLVGLLPFVIGDSETAMPAWMFASIVVGAITAASILSAVAMVLVARRRRLQPSG